VILKKPEASDLEFPLPKSLIAVISTSAMGNCFFGSLSCFKTAPLRMIGCRQCRRTMVKTVAKIARAGIAQIAIFFLVLMFLVLMPLELMA
jgi:hypothetical protein